MGRFCMPQDIPCSLEKTDGLMLETGFGAPDLARRLIDGEMSAAPAQEIERNIRTMVGAWI
jgi:hypothetical protein